LPSSRRRGPRVCRAAGLFDPEPIRNDARQGGPVKTEDDPLDPAPATAMRLTIAAMNDLDQAVTAVGIALRYGSFYGDPIDPLVTLVRARKWPIVGDGGSVWSYIHLEDAALCGCPARRSWWRPSDRRRDGRLVLSTVAAATSVGLTQAILSGRHGGFSISHPGVLPSIARPALIAPVRALIGMGIGTVVRHAAAAL
jgi:hypothetical protein